MKIDLVFLVILGFMVLKTICNKTVVNNEHMGDPAPTPTLDPKITTAINDAIKTLYSADVSAIQNLSLIANKLQTGGYTCPGDYTVTGKMTVGGALTVKGRDILAELDALNNKTQHITADAEKTLINSNIYCAKPGAVLTLHYLNKDNKILYSCNISCENGDLINHNGTKYNISGAIRALETKTQNITAETNASQTVFKSDIKSKAHIAADGYVYVQGHRFNFDNDGHPKIDVTNIQLG